MFAVIESGGKQHRVQEGDVLRLEKLAVEAGGSVTFDRVMMVGEGDDVAIGTPVVDGSSVTAEVLAHGRGDKVIVFKRKRRKGYRKKQGHRQNFTEIRIDEVALG